MFARARRKVVLGVEKLGVQIKKIKFQKNKFQPAFLWKCNSGKEFYIDVPSVVSGCSKKEQ